MRLARIAERLRIGSRWIWTSDDYRAALPEDFEARIVDLDSADRRHSKQGRTTARVRFDSPWGELSVYLKRHDRMPIRSRIAAILDPSGRHTPASAEWAHLDRVRGLGVAVPDVVAAGETIGPWGKLEGFLMVADLVGSAPLHEAIPALFESMEPAAFADLKRSLATELAVMVASLHRAKVFHKDLYLCHVFLDMARLDRAGRRLTLIDLHRLGEHRFSAIRWRIKDLGQLLFSTEGVDGLDGRDRLRFWRAYRRQMGLRFARYQATLIRNKAARYLAHNR